MNEETATIFLQRDFQQEGDWSTYKTLRDKKVNYTIEEEYEGRINMYFESRNIKGYVGVRGTRIWFSPKVMTRYVYRNSSTIEECTFTDYEKHEHYPDETFAFRFSSMEGFLNNWITQKTETRGDFCGYFTTDSCSITKDLDAFFKYLLPSFHNEFLFLREFGSGEDNISVIHDYDTIITELSEIYSIAKKHNVTFFWV